MTVPEQWLQKAKYDIETARAMLKAERYEYVLFCCQQAVEKSLKAIIADRTKKMPPRLHNLIALSDTAGLAVDDVRADVMRALTDYYIDSRYPEIAGGQEGGVDRQLAEEFLGKTEGLLRWLTTLMKT